MPPPSQPSWRHRSRSRSALKPKPSRAPNETAERMPTIPAEAVYWVSDSEQRRCICVCTYNCSDVFSQAKSAAAILLALPGKVIDFAVTLDEKWPQTVHDTHAKCVALPRSENRVAGVGVGYNKKNLEQAAALALLLAVEVERRVLPGVKSPSKVQALQEYSKELPWYVDAAEQRYRKFGSIPIGLGPDHDEPAYSASSEHTTPADADNELVAELQWLLKKAEGERDSLKAETNLLKAEIAERKMRELELQKALSAASKAELKGLSAESTEEHAHAQLQVEFRGREEEQTEAERFLSSELSKERDRARRTAYHLKKLALFGEMEWHRYEHFEMAESRMFQKSCSRTWSSECSEAAADGVRKAS